MCAFSALASVLVVFAPMRAEARAVRGALPGARVIRTGMGRRRARLAARREGPGSEPMVVAGFCGAVDPSLRPGDIVTATEVRSPDRSWAIPSAGLIEGALRRHGMRVVSGPMVTSDRLVHGSARGRLRDDGAVAVDMESADLVAAAAGPAAVVRVVVDTPHNPLLRPRTLASLHTARDNLRRIGPALTDWADAARPRRLLLASPRSFCAGVDRAIEIVERSLKRYGPPVYVRRQIVHNAHVVARLERRGAIFVEELDEVPDGAVVVFSAHGVAPAVRAEAAARDLRVLDATCPLVAKVHVEARRFAARGDAVVLIGHDGHDEVEGTLGEAPGRIHLVQNVEDVSRLELPDPDRVSYLMQTTLAVDEASGVVQALYDRFPQVTGPPTHDICYATTNRQAAVREVAQRSDLVLVLGSENSSNSRRLVEVAEREGATAHLVDDETQIDLRWLADADTVGITAGASAPPSLVDRVVTAIGGLGEVDVEEHAVVEESMQFSLPKEVD